MHSNSRHPRYHLDTVCARTRTARVQIYPGATYYPYELPAGLGNPKRFRPPQEDQSQTEVEDTKRRHRSTRRERRRVEECGRRTGSSWIEILGAQNLRHGPVPPTFQPMAEEPPDRPRRFRDKPAIEVDEIFRGNAQDSSPQSSGR